MAREVNQVDGDNYKPGNSYGADKRKSPVYAGNSTVINGTDPGGD